ncbi:MAG: MBL fold metallo-hydrolase [Deltaproteobacteria bacterium]|nr:MBL fold metallo-hydrolase [Deltaproteobacteria bacterium]MBW2053116.1 MBL fold metallo-hydrolase [Deltaproteobacteria bacterium]MBW2141449.1 MBL fold metallo-hydrolase [Deltaproteobacteria bacterium]MBW2322580.1 MBL fold metallo-hydrolase [Deltaproteobacteria bacterium]
MIIRCYGARGSIPVSGEEYAKYGGDTTCFEIRTKNDEIIIVDAGSGIRRLGNKLLGEQRFEYNILFTHSHWDHILGFPFFKPIYNEKTTLNLMGCPEAQGNIKKLLSKTMRLPYFPIPFDKLRSENIYSGECPASLRIDSVEILHINLSHPNIGLGYKFIEDGKTLVILTDNELGYKHRGGRSFDEYAEFAREADFLIHDAEYTPEQYKTAKTWGHSTYVDALNLAFKARVKHFGLFHHNQDRNDAEQDSILQDCQSIIESKKFDMACSSLTQTTEIHL